MAAAYNNWTPVVGSPVVGSPVIQQQQFQVPSPAGFQLPYPTPSPFPSISATSQSSKTCKDFVREHSNLALRFLAFVCTFISAIAIASPAHVNGGDSGSFLHFWEFRYCLVSAIVASVYSAIQLFRVTRDIAFKGGLFVSDNVSDYITFILDQMVSYLLLSSSSVSVLGVDRNGRGRSKNAAVASICLLFIAFSAIAISTLISGYRLCKRIMW